MVPEMFARFDRVVGRHTGKVCDKIAVVRPNWLEPVFALLSLDIGTPRYDACECLDGCPPVPYPVVPHDGRCPCA